MKVKTSVTLSEELLEAISSQERTRSEFLEIAAWAFLAVHEREERYRREVAVLNQHANELNAYQADALQDQADL